MVALDGYRAYSGEIWVADRSLAAEGFHFIADAVVRLKEKARGEPEDRAYEAGLEAERFLRRKVSGLRFRGRRMIGGAPPELYVEPYFTIPDPEFPV